MVTSLVTRDGRIFFGWFVVAASLLVSFGVIGGQFSFGVFMKPMTEDFGWSRATLSLAFGTTFMLSGLLRPVAGYLADRYSPKWVALSGVAIMGTMLLVLTQVQNLTQLYIVFAVMALGITLGSGSALAKIVSAWFHRSRGVTLGLAHWWGLHRRRHPSARRILLHRGGQLAGGVLVPWHVPHGFGVAAGHPVHTYQAPRHGSGTTEGHPRAGRPPHRSRGDAEGT